MKIKKSKLNKVFLRLDDSQYQFLEKQSNKSAMSIPDLLRLYIDYLRFKDSQNENSSSSI